MRIFLIRHGESTCNSGDNYVSRLPDHLVPLTEKGEKQAEEGGKWLAKYCEENGVDLTNARIWRSPFKRTRQTSDIFNESLKIGSVLEDVTLTEQQYGLFDAVPEEKWGELYPVEFAEYQRQKTNSGRFYARTPLGESPFDVAIRVQQFIEVIKKDNEKKGVDTLFVFAHGTVMRTFLLRWFHYSPEWYETEKNPRNCYIREITEDLDKGYIYKGESN